MRLPSSSLATSFTGVNQLLDGLQDWLQQNQNREVTERQSSERSGLELTLTAQGLRAKPPAKPTRKRPRPAAAFVLCDGQEGSVERWRSAKSCRCGLEGEALTRLKRGMKNPKCGRSDPKRQRRR